MRIVTVLFLSSLTSACIQDFNPGHPHCLTRADCVPEVLGDGFDEPRYNCENNECLASSCGDGVLDEGETCDDGNSKDDDTCSNLCAPPTCGDGLLQGEEVCDDGARNNDHRANACRTTCTAARCGDGVLDQDEICDDGNAQDGDACRNTCIEGVCGDGVTWGYEQGGDEDCDDGNQDETDGCNTRCRSLYCGDGIRQGEDASGTACGGEEAIECSGFQTCVEGFCEGWGEECDEGSSNSDELADSCRNSCRLAYCGDNVLDTAEQCDDGNLSDGDGCSSGCAGEPAVCGDGNVHFSEECDDGNNFDNDSCLSDCRVAHCGDGVIRDDIQAGQPAYEECDDGNANDFDICRNDCSEARCGDGAARLDLQVGTQDACTQQNPACPPNETCNGTVCETISYESCDDGNDVHEDGCLLNCRLARCGDGVRRVDFAQGEAGYEACDDGNDVDDDECRNDCSRSSCGDGELHEGLEQCDDGNRVDEDACTNVCTLARCGDGVVRDVGAGTGVRCGNQDPCLGGEVCDWGFCRPAGYEYCDDGNDWVGDGCNAQCQPPPCGDGLLQEGEACEDGNQFDWDGCSGTCETEPWPYCGTVLRSITLRQGGDPVAMDVSGESAIVSFADGDLTWVNLNQGNVVLQSFVGRQGEGEAPDYARWIAMRPNDANFVAFGLRRGLSFRLRNGQQIAETFTYPSDGDVEAYRAGNVGGWADNNRMVFQQNQVNQLDGQGNPLLNQDG
ncbi:MAG: DUF4215 domain-containing protein, partial [Myxococcota bacterium]|nr:DUF4215 domain-containing protein [Myxococcota bacterium]